MNFYTLNIDLFFKISKVKFRFDLFFFLTDQNLTLGFSLNYSRSLRFGFREGSLERKPKINKETKKITVV